MINKKTDTIEVTPEEAREDILDAVLAHVPFDGWHTKSVERGLEDTGYSEGFFRLAFPGGIREVVDFYLKRADARLAAELERQKLSEMRIRDRIATAIKVRLLQHVSERAAIERTLAWLHLPGHVRLGAKSLWRTADVMWCAAGDTATDYNYYTKRAILSGVYSATLVFWLQDESEDFEDTWSFLNRRIENVMQFEKVKAKARTVGTRLPDPFKILGRLRYPEGHQASEQD